MYKELGHSKIGFRQLGSDHFRLFAVSDGGSGGGGSGNSGSGGGNSGDGGSDAATMDHKNSESKPENQK